MTEFFASCLCGYVYREKNTSWNKIDRKIKTLGLELNGEKVQELNIPLDAQGLIQCKYATIQGGITKIDFHIIGYVDKEGKNNIAVVDYNTGKLLNVQIKLDLRPHTIRA